jgi:hypothetical protein
MCDVGVRAFFNPVVCVKKEEELIAFMASIDRLK